MKGTKRNILVLLSVSVALMSLSLAGNYQDVNGKDKTEVKLSKGEWTFATHPYVGPGFKLRPAIVNATTFNPTEGLRRVVLTNNTEKPITSVKLSWRLFTKQKPNEILQKGESAFIKFDEKLKPEEQRAFNCSINSYKEFLESLQKEGKLKGDFRLDVAVSEIRYEDNSSWRGEEITKTEYVKSDSINSSAHLNKKVQFVKASNQTKMTSGGSCSASVDGCYTECVFAGFINGDGCPIYECQPTTEPFFCVDTTPPDPICPGSRDCTMWLCPNP
ncbi:MAG: hypothetical protein ACR2N3_09240 [Pyrinomonadaceae bacterium]